MTEAVAQSMRGRSIDLFVHHSSVALEERREAEERFNGGTNACIVCTSTLELGIDVGDLDLVFQENATSTVSSFLQRMGRTGRREGAVANTTFFCEACLTQRSRRPQLSGARRWSRTFRGQLDGVGRQPLLRSPGDTAPPRNTRRSLVAAS